MILVRGECSRCGVMLQYDAMDDQSTADLYLTVPGRGAFAKTVWQAELICKNAQECFKRQERRAGVAADA